jgi:hypothetical protein
MGTDGAHADRMHLVAAANFFPNNFVHAISSSACLAGNDMQGLN